MKHANVRVKDIHVCREKGASQQRVHNQTGTVTKTPHYFTDADNSTYLGLRPAKGVTVMMGNWGIGWQQTQKHVAEALDWNH